jgi:hypothetical protein
MVEEKGRRSEGIGEGVDIIWSEFRTLDGCWPAGEGVKVLECRVFFPLLHYLAYLLLFLSVKPWV